MKQISRCQRCGLQNEEPTPWSCACTAEHLNSFWKEELENFEFEMIRGSMTLEQAKLWLEREGYQVIKKKSTSKKLKGRR